MVRRVLRAAGPDHGSVRRAASQSDDRDPRDRQTDRLLRAEQPQGRRDAVQVRPDRRGRRATLARQSRLLHGRCTGGAAAQFAPDRSRQARRRSRWSAAPIPATPASCWQTSCSPRLDRRDPSSSRCGLRFRRCRRCTSRSSAAICAPRRSSSSRPSPGASWGSKRQHGAGPAHRPDRRVPPLRADHDARHRQQGRSPVHAGRARRHGRQSAARDLAGFAARFHQGQERGGQAFHARDLRCQRGLRQEPGEDDGAGCRVERPGRKDRRTRRRSA